VSEEGKQWVKDNQRYDIGKNSTLNIDLITLRGISASFNIQLKHL
jgi:hypothetical protein